MTDALSPEPIPQTAPAIFSNWSERHSLLLLSLATLACLLPFSNKALHMDDPLFVWTAQHIAHHPLDPYGFRIVWYATEAPIADITKNPPLASYYLALFGWLFGWSERTLHLALFLPALVAVLGTYALAKRFTRYPLLAAAATLLAPGFLVSSTTVMSDVLMLAFWIGAIVLWLEGTDSDKPWHLFAAALLIAACSLTKYFGVALIPLLLVYSVLKKRRLDLSAAWLFLPVFLLAIYQYTTKRLYGRGLLSDAIQYASLHNRGHELPVLIKALVGVAFAGGCAIPVLFLAPFLWSRRSCFVGTLVCATAGLAAAANQPRFEAPLASAHWPWISIQLAVFAAGGLCVLSLAAAGPRRMDAGNLLAGVWIAGTFLFAAFVNWTINARSILPLIPAVAILAARRLEAARVDTRGYFFAKVGGALAASCVIAIWVAVADARLADAGRSAAAKICAEHRASSSIYFEGHWGFQYYMQQMGAKPADLRLSPFRAGDTLLIPENTTNSFGPPPGFALSGSIETLELRSRVATMSQPMGAGFYASVWGPLPYAFARVPPERYLIARLVPAAATSEPAATDGKP